MKSSHQPDRRSVTSEPGNQKQSRAFLYVLTVGIFITALDQTVVVTAIPSMVFDLDIEFRNIDRAAWIVNGFLIGYAVALPLAGRLADIYSRRLVFVGALGIFAAASLAAALADNLWFLVGARFLQAAGSGALIPVALAQAAGDYRGRSRIVVFGLIIAVAEMGGVLGPFWGAAITQFAGWRWIFYINLPLAALLALTVLFFRDRSTPVRVPLDWRGAILAMLGLTLLTVGIARDEIMSGLIVAVLIIAALVVLAAFVAVERRTAAPLMNLNMFRRQEFSAGNLASLLVGAGLIVPMVNLPLYAATVLERDALGGGLLLIQMTMAIPVGAIVGGFAASRIGNATIVSTGAALAGLGLLLASRWGISPGDTVMTRDLLIAGAGFGLVIAPLTGVVVAGAGRDNAGVGAAMVSISRLLGMMIALASLTPWALRRFNAAASTLPLPLGTGTESAAELDALGVQYQLGIKLAASSMFADLLVLGAVLCWVAIVPGLWLLRYPTVRPV